MRSFGTQGRVRPEQHYIVPRTAHVADFIARIRAGKYIVLFAPRQTGKTTFFRLALNALLTEAPNFFPIQLNFEEYHDYTPPEFYGNLYEDIHEAIENVFQKRGEAPAAALTQFLENTELTDHVSMRRFFTRFARFLRNQRVIVIIDEFDGIPQAAVKGFLHSLRHIYLSDELLCPYSVSIVGVKSITQLDYDRSVSPFNIQDEFRLPNFTRAEVDELLAQYTDEVGQAFVPEVITAIHRQTAGQPFLVNRCAQILTEELDIPKTETLTMLHFSKAYRQLLRERNTNIEHLLTNIRRHRRFESLLMRIASYERGLPFSLEIARAGFRILQVPNTPQEYVGQYLLYAYLDHFVRSVGADMFLEVQTGRGRIDLLILHNRRKYIVETKIWEGDRYYQSGKTQLAAYLKLEDTQEGYYVVFDHRQQPKPLTETERIDGVKIRSYIIPVMQERPSSV